METPRIDPEPMMKVRVQLNRLAIGTTPYRIRVEVPFEGVATSHLWDGEWRCTGVDHITRGTHGTSSLDVHAVITNGDEAIIYHGCGRGGPNGIIEGITFETASERLALLNDVVAIGQGAVEGTELTVEIFRVRA